MHWLLGAYLILGIPCLILVLCEKKTFCHNLRNTLCPKTWDKTLCQHVKTFLGQIEWLEVFGVILVFIAGALYLAGNNLDLYLPLEDHLNENIRSYWLGTSLALGIVPTVFRTFGGGIVVKPGPRWTKLITSYKMVFRKLFPMLMSTVQLDQIYTTIAGEVTYHRKEFQDGTNCSRDNVIAGIIFFIAVCAIWTVAVWGVTAKHIKEFRKFEKDNLQKQSDERRNCSICNMWVFWVILIVYTPGYIALDNNWPWICVAKCHLQEECIISEEEQCSNVEKFIIGKLIALLIVLLATLEFLYMYFDLWCKLKHCLEEDDNEDPISQQHSADYGATQETESLM